MKIFDRYLLTRFCNVLFFSLLAFIAIFLVVDNVEHLDDFVDQHASGWAVFRYYFYWLPYLTILAMPVAMLMATLFSLSMLAKHHELIAMKASGISLYRILLPLYLLALVVSLLVMLAGELVLPGAYRLRSQVKEREIDKTQAGPVMFTNLYLLGNSGRIFHFGMYDHSKKTGQDVLVQRFRGSRIVEETRAQRLIWNNKHWIAEKGQVRRFAQEPDTAHPDTFRTFEKEVRFDFTEKPEEFVERRQSPNQLGFRELKRYIAFKERTGEITVKEKVDLYLKISFPLVNLIIVLFGSPLIANPRKSGLALSFGLTLVITFSYYTLIKLIQSLGYNQKLPPLVSAWAVNIFFAVVGLILLIRARK